MPADRPASTPADLRKQLLVEGQPIPERLTAMEAYLEYMEAELKIVREGCEEQVRENERLQRLLARTPSPAEAFQTLVKSAVATGQPATLTAVVGALRFNFSAGTAAPE